MDVKIGSKAISKRLKKILPYIIHQNQCAYIKGTTTFDAVRTIQDVMDYRKRCHIDGRVICIDFQRAFDTVSREFVFHTLSAFGFGCSFIQWFLHFTTLTLREKTNRKKDQEQFIRSTALTARPLISMRPAET